MAGSTSFVQFEHCSLCKINHKKKKKHIYAKRHQEILRNILRKYENKIQTAKATLLNPEIQPLDFEMGAKFWCYFCAKEVEKHTREEFCIVQYGGLLYHIASDDHLKKLLQFFWDNIVERSLKTKYILMANELEIFKKTSFLAVKNYEKSLEIKIKQMAEQIHSVEQKRHQDMIQSMQEKPETSLTRLNSRMLPPKEISIRRKPAGKKTIYAYGEGLTWIQNIIADARQKTAISMLNRHPWTGQSGDCLVFQSDVISTGSSLSFQTTCAGENLTFMTKPEVKPYRKKRTWTQSEQTQSSWLTNNSNYKMNTEANLNSMESTRTENSDVSSDHSGRIGSEYDQHYSVQTDSFGENGTSSIEKWNFTKNVTKGHRQDSYSKPLSTVQYYQKHLVTGSNHSGHLFNPNAAADGFFIVKGHGEIK
ncbi:hypothetical protein ACJMK2_026930 [Sinanodonta woodiana]|uniref:Coiled-coil domain-containing protein 84 n=1 Tax=Sinanodonta woodiana TaxID=1069815 RepID=A0ABD3XL65_SINWO